MAQKDYTKGLALLAFQVERYIARYNLDNPSAIQGPWTSQLQQAAATMKSAAATINGAIQFRQQP